MSQNCCPTSGQAKEFLCPSCGAKGRLVQAKTVCVMVNSGITVTDKAYKFCTTPDCQIVYFGPNGALIEKRDVKVRIGVKETDDPIPVCYCFGYTQRDILNEIRATGSSLIPGKIRAEIKAGNCACEINNPSGSCCLGEVSRIVKLGLAGTHTKEVGVK